MDDFGILLKEMEGKFSVLADEILKADPPKATPFQSAEQATVEAKAALMDILTAKDIRTRLERGFLILARELVIYEPPIFMDTVREEWVKYSHFIINDMKNKPSTEEEKLPLTDGTLERFYQCGLRLYKNKMVQEAADVFFVINSLDNTRHNVWMALGLSEKELNHYEEALVAFSMAIVTNKESVPAFIHSAECYITLGEKADAEDCIKAGLDLLQDKQDHKSMEMESYLRSLKT